MSGVDVELRVAGLELPMPGAGGFGGWGAAGEGERELRVRIGGDRFRLRDIARWDGRLIRLADAGAGAPLPGYLVRRRVQRRLELRGRGAVTVFTDAAGVEQVWAWVVERPSGVRAYREHARERGASLEGVLLALRGEERELVGDRGDSEFRQGAEAARRALLASLGRRVGHGALPGGRRSAAVLQELVEGSAAPERCRVVWAGIERLRILDPGCGEGQWLAGCREALAEVAEACLERMAVWVEEQRRAEGSVRPERLSDFKRWRTREGELARSGGRGRLAREMVLLRCLRGVEADGEAAAVARRRLAAGLGGAEGGEEALVDLRVGRLEGGVARETELARLVRRDPGFAGRVRGVVEEVDALMRAEAQLIRMRLQLGVPLAEMEEGRGLLARRRAAVTEEIALRLPPAPEGTLHRWVEFGEEGRHARFRLVRRAGRRTA